MATVSAARSDVFPVGTSVGVYPANAAVPGVGASGTAIASGTVDAAGNLSVTNGGITDYTPYTLYALVNGEHRYLRVRSTLTKHDYGTVVGTGDTTNGSATVLNATASSGSFQIGQRLSGPGIKPGTLIHNVVSTTLTLDQTATATATGVALQGEGAFTAVARTKRRKVAIGTAP